MVVKLVLEQHNFIFSTVVTMGMETKMRSSSGSGSSYASAVESTNQVGFALVWGYFTVIRTMPFS